MIEIIFINSKLKYHQLKFMKHIELIGKFELGGEIDSEKDIEARQVFKGSGRQIMEVKLRNNAVLSKHKVSEPITVFCLAGRGKFLAGEDLQEEQILETGTLLTLAAEIPHEVIAEPDLQILVTKFKQD